MRAAGILLCLLSVPLAAQTQPDWLSRFALHGYLSQAYADSDEFPIFGIPTDGTTDYRDLALQLRFDANAKNAFVVQIRQERFGESARQSDDVALDWAFYGYEFSERLAVKAGRIPLPLGIFNEASGAATTSPFFRPPYEFYTRQFSSKTVDGALVTASLGRAGGWSFDVDAYGGRWALDEWSDSASADAEDAWGAQVWANTPWPGVRLGAGAYRCSVQAPYTAPADYVMLHASVDADLDRWRLASEFLTGDLDRFGRYQAAYGQAGYQFTPRFSAHGRLSAGRMRIPVNGHHIEPTISRDLGLSLNYSPLPALLFKLEGHTNEGFLRQDAPPDYYGEPSETRYFIASVVASF